MIFKNKITLAANLSICLFFGQSGWKPDSACPFEMMISLKLDKFYTTALKGDWHRLLNYDITICDTSFLMTGVTFSEFQLSNSSALCHNEKVTVFIFDLKGKCICVSRGRGYVTKKGGKVRSMSLKRWYY